MNFGVDGLEVDASVRVPSLGVRDFAAMMDDAMSTNEIEFAGPVVQREGLEPWKDPLRGRWNPGEVDRERFDAA
jgi:hypothetical protein